MDVGFLRLGATPLLLPRSGGCFGGAEVRAVTFARGLVRWTDHRVVFLTQGDERPAKTLPDGIQVTFVPGRRRLRNEPRGARLAWRLPLEISRRLATSARSRWSDVPATWDAVARLNVDALACFGIHDPTASAIKSARASGKRSILFLTSDADVEQAFQPGRTCRRHVRRRQRYAICQADEVVAQTEYQRQRLRQLAGREASLIRNPIDTHVTGRDLLPLERRRHVLWVGRADRDCKRADRCLDLAQRCPSVPFLAVMNPVDPREFRWFVEHAPNNLRIVESVPLALSDRLFRASRAVLNTSDSEGFPNTFLQAAKFGCPIISWSVNPDDVLTRHRCGYVAQGNVERMASMVRTAWRHPGRFRYVAACARHYLASHHDLKSQVARLDQLLTQQSALSGSRQVA
jgi:hypothetical protein